MPKKGYRMTEEHKQKIRESNRLAHLGFYTDKTKNKCLNCDNLVGKRAKTKLCVNCCKIGNKRNLGKKRKPFSLEWRRKIGEKAKGNKYNLGRKATEKTRKKMSDAKKNKRPKNFGISFGVKGKPLTIETRIKISKSHSKENSYNWKGGIEVENRRIRKGVKFKIWRESIFFRDNWTCQKCKQRGKKLHPHHIKNFSKYVELRFSLDNGITFCEKCHINFHKQFGMINNTTEQINKFLYDN